MAEALPGWTDVADPPTTKPAIKVSVAIVEAHQSTRDHLIKLLRSGGTPFGSMADLAARVTGNVPVVMVLGPSCNNHNDLGAAQRVIQTNPTLGAILIAEPWVFWAGLVLVVVGVVVGKVMQMMGMGADSAS